jgi:hypothetical protein
MLELILWLLAITISGLALSAALLAAVRVADRAEAAQRNDLPAPEAPWRFFATPYPVVPSRTPDLPVEVLLRRLEQHVRLEQAVAESFHLAPTVESLHRPTASPLVLH